MDYIARKVNIAKWEPVPHIDGIRADALKCIQTRQDKLSVWECDNTIEDVEEVTLAMAAAMDHLVTIHLVLLRKDDIDQDALTWSLTSGDTPVLDLRNRHIDLLDLNIEHINKLARRIAEQAREASGLRYVFRRSAVKNLLIKAIETGRLNADTLQPHVRDKIPL